MKETGMKSLLAAHRSDVEMSLKSDGARARGHREGDDCPCEYCKKLRWVLDRADHYAEHLGATRDEVIAAWEEQRGYWWLNFYQDSNQPRIGTDEGILVKVFDTQEDFLATIKRREFRCPACKRISKNPYNCDQSGCDWASYGLLQTMGFGVKVLIRRPILSDEMFMPVDWETPA